MTSKTLGEVASYEAVAAKAKELYDDNFSNLLPNQRPRWESQPLEYRTTWLNKAARLPADQL